METILIKALQLILSFTLLVLIHEGGHFLFAKIFKIRVEKFCVFFDPWFTLFKFKPKRSDTEYALGWLPLGGYVKIAGMIDESMDTEQMKQPEQPWEFRSKPAWQRLLVMVGGVLFNFLLALFVYSMIMFAWGDEYVRVSDAPLGMEFNETAKSIGFRDGDVLLAADGVPFERYDEKMLGQIVDARTVTVRRDGAEETVYIPEDMMTRLMQDSMKFLAFRMPYVLEKVIDGTPAAAAGLMSGDSITRMDGKSISYFEFVEEMERRSLAAGNDSVDMHGMTLTYYRDGVERTAELTADENFKIGVVPREFAKVMPVVQMRYGFFQSFPAGVNLGISKLSSYVNNLKYVFSKEGVKQVGGFAAIASLFPSAWDWHQFWYMTAFLSIMLAVMNILPIPALDGGHILFLVYEIVARRKPSDKFMEYAQTAGMIFLFALLILANFNDIVRYLF
jgi:regulator of sigma E protease